MVQKVGFFGILACASVSGFNTTPHRRLITLVISANLSAPVDADESELERLTTKSVWLWIPTLTSLKRNCLSLKKLLFYHLRNNSPFLSHHVVINWFLHLFSISMMVTTHLLLHWYSKHLIKLHLIQNRVRTWGVNTPLPLWLLLAGCQWRDILFYYIYISLFLNLLLVPSVIVVLISGIFLPHNLGLVQHYLLKTQASNQV